MAFSDDGAHGRVFNLGFNSREALHVSRRRVELAVSLASGDIGRVAESAAAAEAAGADRIHIDIEDGIFIPSFTLGPKVVGSVRRVTSLPLDVHLQCQDPGRWLGPVLDMGADMVLLHPEGTTELVALIERILRAGRQAGLALLPGSPVVLVEPALDVVTRVDVMTADVAPGDVFWRPALKKVRELSERVASVGVDGDVNVSTVGLCIEAGATVLNVGRAAFEPPNIAAALDRLRRAIAEHCNG